MTGTSNFRNWLHDSRENGLLAGGIFVLALLVLFGFTLYFLAFPLCLILPFVMGYRYARPVKYSGRWEAVLSGARSGATPAIPAVIMMLASTIILAALTLDKDGLLFLIIGLPWTAIVLASGCFGGLCKALTLPSEQLAPMPDFTAPPPTGEKSEDEK